MELQFAPKTTLSSGPQGTAQPASATGAENSAAAPTIQSDPSQVVTVAAEAAATANERRQDKLGKQPDETVTAQQVIESLHLTNRRTQLDFNDELNVVFLQIVDTRTDEVVETIPPEELVRQLKASVDPPTHVDFANSGGAVLDESV